jgi:hypothetical protein
VPCRPGESAEEVLARSYAINVAGDVWAAEASVRPMYDPTSARMRA